MIPNAESAPSSEIFEFLPPNAPVEQQQIDHNDRRKDSQLSAPIGLLYGVFRVILMGITPLFYKHFQLNMISIN